MTASGTTSFIQPKYLTAAALAWTVVSNTKKVSHGVPEAASDEDTTAVMDPVPDMDYVKPVTSNRQVYPVVVTPVANATVARTKPSPQQPRVSAAAMRHLESRRRVRSAMEHSRQVTPVSSGSSVTSASVRYTSPRVTTPLRSSAQNTPDKQAPALVPTTSSARSISGGASVSTTPLKVVHCQPVHFKVKSSTSGTVLRFQCVPTYGSVAENILQRLNGNGSTTSLWSTATNALSSTLDYASAVDRISVNFQDAEGDWCTLSNDDDVQDAVEAAMGRKDSMVRLIVEEHGAGTRVWKSLSTKFGW